MIEELSKRMLKQLETELDEIAMQVSDPLSKLTSALKPVRASLKKLRGLVLDRPFSSVEEEVRFFKSIKPEFYKWQVYFSELYTIETGMPVSGAEAQLAWFEEELGYISRFFRQYGFQYQYYKLGASELDHLYFVRGVESSSLLMPSLPEPDPLFSTSSDYLFSKIKAFELLRDWLIERINYLKKNPLLSYHAGAETEELRWTGDSINLAELAFGIHRTGQLNNGTATVGSIFRWMEEKLSINIGIPSKRLSEIRRRTSMSRTRFLDEMAEELVRKLDKDDEYVPDKGMRKS